MHRHLYCLLFSNGKKYIGISTDPKARLAVHCHRARNESRIPVHAAIRKYGIPDLRLLCIGDKNYIITLEIKAIAAFNTQDRKFGYNSTAGGNPGIEMTPKIRAKIGATLTGRKRSPIAIARSKATCDSQPGYHERRGAKIRLAWTPELRAASRAWGQTKTVPPEIRAQISKTLMGHPGAGKGMRRPAFGEKIRKMHLENGITKYGGLLCTKCGEEPRIKYTDKKYGLRRQRLCASCVANYKREWRARRKSGNISQ